MRNRQTARVIIAGLLVIAAASSGWLGLRTYGSLRFFLQSAQLLGRPEISSVRGWMTLSYMTETYRAPIAELLVGLRPIATITMLLLYMSMTSMSSC
jgi:hypothetical protein